MLHALAAFRHWDIVALLIALGIVLGLEMLGVIGGKPYITLTELLRTYVPKWGLAMAWGWLGYHFLIQK